MHKWAEQTTMNCVYMNVFNCLFRVHFGLQPLSVHARTLTHLHRVSRVDARRCVLFRGVRQVMDTSCLGRESVCLGMMKSSTCPHSSSPLHILIIANLQTYSKGHTRTHTCTFRPPPPQLTPLPQIYTSVKILSAVARY